MYKAIIFDFFGVLSAEVAVKWFSQHFRPEQAIEFKEKYTKETDLGLISEDQLMKDLSDIVHTPPEEIKREWRDLVEVDPIMISLVARLGEKYKIGLCTNAAASFIRPILEKNNLTRLFDSIVVSSEVGLVKPASDIYHYILRELQVKPKEAIFIDDGEKNLESASLIGIKTILFKSSRLLVRELGNILNK